MRKIITGIILVLVVIAAIVALAPYLITTQTISSKITSKLEDLTGRQVTFQGEPKLSYSPYLGIKVSDLKLENQTKNEETAALLSVEKVEAQIELLPLLIGNIQITNFKFLRPKLSLTVDKSGAKNWVFKQGQLHDALLISKDNRENNTNDKTFSEKLGLVTIQDGIVEYKNAATQKSETFTSINGSILWPDVQSSTSIDGNLIWRGEGITSRIDIANLFDILSGSESDIEAELNSQPITLDFAGKANMLADLFVKGEIEASTPSIARLAQVLKLDIGTLTNLENWLVNGEIEATQNNINLSNATFTIGENIAKGAILFTNDEITNSKLNGTLAFETIDIVNSFQNKLEASFETPLQIKKLDIDLRVSAQTLNFGTIALTDVAAAIITNDNGWTFDIGNSTAFNGTLTAKLGQRVNADKRQTFLDISATKVDAQSIIGAIGESPIGLSGKTSFISSVRTNTLNDRIFTAGLNGDFEGTFNAGQLIGLNLQEALSGEETQLPKVTQFDKAKLTNFDTIKLKFFLNQGVATLSQTELEKSGQKIRISGSIDTKNGALDITAQEILEGAPKATRLLISGTTDKPSFGIQSGPKPTN